MPKLLQTAATHCFLSKARLSLAPFLLPLLRVCAAVCSRETPSVRQRAPLLLVQENLTSRGKRGRVVTLNQLKALELFLIWGGGVCNDLRPLTKLGASSRSHWSSVLH